MRSGIRSGLNKSIINRRQVVSSIGNGFWGDDTSDPLEPIRSVMEVWYDGTISGSQLIDKSGNNRHATVTSNLISNKDAVLGSTFIQQTGTTPSLNTSVNTSPPSGFTGQYYSKIQWTSVPTTGVIRTERFILLAESGYIDFWAKKVSNTTILFGLQPGNGGALLFQSNLSTATYLIGGSQAVGNWGHYRVPFTNVNAGGVADFRFQVLSGTHDVEIFFPPDYTESSQTYGGVTISGQTNICFSLPVDPTLSGHDTKFNWYSQTTGFPLTTRAAYQYNAFVKRIFCGGAMSYIFLKTDPTILTYKILANNFENLDHAFDSCPVVLTVGSGKTYSTIQAAISVANTGSFLNRRRIEVYDDLTVSTYAEYTVVSGGGSFMAYVQMNRTYDYITSVGGRKTITATKQVSLNDAQSNGTEVLTTIYPGGWRGIDINKTNGGYVWHQDAAGNGDTHLIFKDCNINENGAQGIFDYRTANAQPQPAVQMSFNTLAGGMHDNHIIILSGVTLRGMRPYTWQDVGVTSGNGGNMYCNNCTLESEVIYDPVSNPTSELKESIRLTSSGIGNTTIYMTGTTRNSTINEVGAIKSIFITEL